MCLKMHETIKLFIEMQREFGAKKTTVKYNEDSKNIF